MSRSAPAPGAQPDPRLQDEAGAPRDPGLDAADEWHRLHPLSPVLRGWLMILAFLGIMASNLVDDVVVGNGLTGADHLGDWVDGLPGWAAVLDGLALWLVLLVAVLLVLLVSAAAVALGSLFVWWFTRYQVTPTHVRLRQGALFRQERQARLDRVQAIDIQRPLMPRLVGLAELRFEVADAGDTSVVLRYLRHGTARELRTDLLAAIGGRPGPPPVEEADRELPAAPWAREVEQQEAAPDDELVLRVPHGRVLGSWALSPTSVSLVVVGLSALVVAVVAPGVLAVSFAGWLPALIGVGTAVVRRLEGSWGFTVHRTEKGLRLRYGLLNDTSQTVPTGRVQALGVRRPLLWRPFGWSEVRVNVAGYGGGPEGGEGSSRTVLVPVASDDHLRRVLAEIGPSSAERESAPGDRADLRAPAEGSTLADLVLEGLTGDLAGDPGTRFTISPPRAARVAWVVRRRRGVAVTPHEVVTVDGRLSRACDIVPHGKIQSLALRHGPVARRLDLADVHLHSIQGPVSPVVGNMDRATAERFLTEQALRSRAAHELV